MGDRNTYLHLLLFTLLTEASCDPGKHFVVTFPQTYEGANIDTTLYFATVGNESVSVSLATLPSAPYVINKTLILAPDQNLAFPVNSSQAVLPTGTYVTDMSIRIVSTGNITVVVKNKRGSNGDTYSPMPVENLGTDHFVLAYNNTLGVSASFVTVTAVYDDTEVNVTFPSQRPINASVTFVLNGVIYTYSDVINIRLGALQTLQVQALLDLTGTRVISSKPIAVLSGANRTQIFKGTCASHLIEQTPSVSTWGMTFILVPVPNQRMGDLYRFVAKDPQTTITLGTGKQIRLQHPGDFGEYLLLAGSVTYAKSDKPVLVGHYATEQEYYTGSDGVFVRDEGDPGLSVLTPVEQATDFYRFGLNDNYKNTSHLYVVFSVPTNLSSQLRINQQTVGMWNVTWRNVTGADNYVVGYVDVGPHQLPFSLGAPGGPVFNAFVHYVTSCESCAMSLFHGYPKDLTPASYVCPTSSSAPGDGIDNDCDGKADEEPCCVNSDAKDTDGDSYKNEDCRGIAGAHVCCSNQGTQYACQERQVSAMVYQIIDHRRRAEVITKAKTNTQVVCVMTCMSTRACWGINFDPTAREGHWCELLFGHGLGLIFSDGWSFWPLNPRSVYTHL
ncbi:uncharacterized protein LOC112558256 [Pomacea canaliculata]|uniref:uncharacterized protein LOC112558256 n=1 Tax=Pomacea canaliculata TaxID=400727 RepID=UPI000D737015|nr:uncharacterized protein LOC112558256 [Pomacea canaliculata]